jgi:indolepyruvate ferredoxin oxidoreductase
MLAGEEDYPDDVDERIKGKMGKDDYFGLPVSEVTEFYMGSKIYSNMVMLGMTYQLGLLPLDARNLEEAIVQSAKAGKQTNIKAFRLGRKLVADKSFADRLINASDFLLIYDEKEWFSRRPLEDVVEEKKGRICDYYFFKSRGKKAGDEYKSLVESIASKSGLERDEVKEIAVRLYDLIKWGNFAYARRYADAVLKVSAKDSRDEGFRATKAALRNLYKVMAIKDELWVAELLLAKEKLHRDGIRYNIDWVRGDTMNYVHLNRPQLDIYVGSVMASFVGGLKKRIPNPTRKKIEIDVSRNEVKIRFDMNTSTLSLRAIRRLKFLRGVVFRHRREESFREWYYNEVIAQFLKGNYRDYEAAVKALSIPFELGVPNHAKGVTGFREVIYPKMELARIALLDKMKPSKEIPQIVNH